MRFALTVTGPAYGTQQASSAWQFAQAVLQEGGTRFADEIRDIVQYRVLEYYWKRYRDKA